MTNSNSSYDYLDFISHLLAAIRRASLYPPHHPSSVSAVKDAYETLQRILNIKKNLSLGLTETNELLIDGQPIPHQDTELLADFLIPYLKSLNIETLIFHSGVTEQELQDYITTILLGPDALKKQGDINKIFLQRNIQHIKANLFSYKRIQKGKRALMLDETALILKELRAKIKEFVQGKIKDLQAIEEIEKKLLALMSKEFKEKNKIGPSLKEIYKKFLTYVPDLSSALLKLKNALQEAGCSSENIDKLVNKIREEVLEKQKAKLDTEEFESLKKENAELQRELEKLNIKNKTLSEAKERLDNILRYMSEGLIVVDPQGKILMVNSAAETVLGITNKDIGKSIKEVIKDEHLLSLVKSFSVDKEGSAEQDIELFSQNESTKKVLRMSSAVVEDHNGRTVGMVTMLNDITKQKEIEKLKSDFVSSVTHELRTPLIALDKSISLLASKSAGQVDENQEQFLSMAQRNLKRLTLLINDLLDLSKLEAGKMELKRQPVAIERIINESIEGLDAWAKTKSIKIEKRIQEGIPEINIDYQRINQVLVNLISNGIKFTPHNGKITVEASLRKENEEIAVSVQDTGIGIAKEELLKIFDKFYQSARGTFYDVSGTGIGLSIAKELVELHGGKIWAESEENQGAKFIFTLPLTNKKG